MEENKYIKISFTTAICTLIILILLIVLATLGFYKMQNSNTDQIPNIQHNDFDSSDIILPNTSNELNNTNNTIENVETDLDINSNIVKDLLKKINFPTYAVASIYKEGDFNLNTISNDLILRLGWSKIDSNDKKLSSNNNTYKQTATKEILKNSILNIFGSKVNYLNESFTNIDVQTFDGYHENKGDIIYSNDLYTANYIQGGGGDVPFIHQEVSKVSKTNNTIKVYVNTAFVNPIYIDNDNGGDFDYIIYKDFKNNEFEEQITKISSEAFYKNYSSDQNLLNSNLEIKNIASQLNTYVYTFELDNSTGEYYLSEFSIAK